MTQVRDVGAEAHQAAEERLYKIAEAEALLEDGVEVEDYPACAPFCGCETCVTREVLDAAWPVIVGGFVAHLRAQGQYLAGTLLLEEFL